MSNTDITKAIRTLETKLPDYQIPTIITSPKQYNDAIDLAAKISRATKQIEEKQDFHAKPHYNEYKRIRESFAPFIETLKTKQQNLKKAMTTWYMAEQKRLDAEQAKIDAAAREAADAGEAIEVAVVNNIKTTETVNGKAQVKMLTKWRVTDITKVAPKYLMVDSKAIDAVVKAGIVPKGIEVYKEPNMNITA